MESSECQVASEESPLRVRSRTFGSQSIIQSIPDRAEKDLADKDIEKDFHSKSYSFNKVRDREDRIVAQLTLPEMRTLLLR